MQFEIRQLRAHLAQQDLDLAAEREAALQAPHVLRQPHSRYKVVEAGVWDEETVAESGVEELRPSPGEPPGVGFGAPATSTAQLCTCALCSVPDGGHSEVSAFRDQKHPGANPEANSSLGPLFSLGTIASGVCSYSL